MSDCLRVAIQAAQCAGDIIVNHMGQIDTLKILQKGLNDWVTTVDHAAEQAIIETILKAYPNHSILAEESGLHPGNEFVWIIDPLDGTRNYLHGFPQFAVSIGLTRNRHLECGLVYDPVRKDLFTASRGKGAQLNNKPIQVSKKENLDGGLVGSAFSLYDREAKLHGIPHIDILQKSFCQRIGCQTNWLSRFESCTCCSREIRWFLGITLTGVGYCSGCPDCSRSGGCCFRF